MINCTSVHESTEDSLGRSLALLDFLVVMTEIDNIRIQRMTGGGRRNRRPCQGLYKCSSLGGGPGCGGGKGLGIPRTMSTKQRKRRQRALALRGSPCAIG